MDTKAPPTSTMRYAGKVSARQHRSEAIASESKSSDSTSSRPPKVQPPQPPSSASIATNHSSTAAETPPPVHPLPRPLFRVPRVEAPAPHYLATDDYLAKHGELQEQGQSLTAAENSSPLNGRGIAEAPEAVIRSSSDSVANTAMESIPEPLFSNDSSQQAQTQPKFSLRTAEGRKRLGMELLFQLTLTAILIAILVFTHGVVTGRFQSSAMDPSVEPSRNRPKANDVTGDPEARITGAEFYAENDRLISVSAASRETRGNRTALQTVVGSPKQPVQNSSFRLAGYEQQEPQEQSNRTPDAMEEP